MQEHVQQLGGPLDRPFWEYSSMHRLFVIDEHFWPVADLEKRAALVWSTLSLLCSDIQEPFYSSQ